MKTKFYILIAFGLFSTLTSKAQGQVFGPGNFETWNNNSLYEQLRNYGSSNFEAVFSGNNPNVVKVSTGNSFGAKLTNLESVNDSGQVILGYFLNGTIEEQEDSPFGGGQPYTAQPDSFSITAKYDIKPNDSANFVIVFKKSGTVIGLNVFTVTGTQENFTELKFKLNTLLVAPDTVFIGITSGNAFTDEPIVGSTLTVDEIKFIGANSGEIVNGGMNDWDLLTFEEPDQFYTANAVSTAAGGIDVPVKKVTTSKSGMYAVEITNSYFDNFNDQENLGVLSTIPLQNFDLNKGGVPFSERPNLLTFDYKYAPEGADTARVIVLLSKWNATTNEREFVGDLEVELTELKTDYAHFEAAIPSTEAPDTVNFVIISGNSKPENDGSILILDNLGFDNKTSIFSIDKNNLHAQLTALTPRELLITTDLKETTDITIDLRDVSGKLVFNKKLENISIGKQENRFTTNALAKGIYLYQINSTLGKTSGKIFIGE